MNLFEDLESKAKEAMNNPQERAKIEKLAKDKGLPMMEAAKQHLIKKQTNSQ